jgi:hypothetical protein
MEFRVSGLKARANSRVHPGWLDAPRRPAAHHRRGMKDRIKDNRAHETTRLIAAAVAQSSQQKLRVPATQGGVPAYLHFLPWPQKDQSWGHFFGRMGLRRQRHSTLRISVPIKTVMVLLRERTRPGRRRRLEMPPLWRLPLACRSALPESAKGGSGRVAGHRLRQGPSLPKRGVSIADRT